VTHSPEIFFAKQAGYWIVTDRITGTRAATTQTQFQLIPGKAERAQDRPAVKFITQHQSIVFI
jgi:hypothetical protein